MITSPERENVLLRPWYVTQVSSLLNHFSSQATHSQQCLRNCAQLSRPVASSRHWFTLRKYYSNNSEKLYVSLLWVCLQETFRGFIRRLIQHNFSKIIWRHFSHLQSLASVTGAEIVPDTSLQLHARSPRCSFLPSLHPLLTHHCPIHCDGDVIIPWRWCCSVMRGWCPASCHIDLCLWLLYISALSYKP